MSWYRKVTDYEIVFDLNIEDLEFQVRELISKGWEPSGDLIVQQTDSGASDYNYFQPMVKKKNQDVL